MIKKQTKRQSNPAMPMVINRDGTLNIHRPPEQGKFFSDFYHYFLSVSWPKFFGILILLFWISNLIFAVLYFFAGPQALEGVHHNSELARFVDCFFFSVFTLNGPFNPSGVWINFLVTLQTYLGMLTLVIVTGLFYARFARPSARVIFCDYAVIGTYDGAPCLTFRLANARLNQIVEAHMELTLSKMYTSVEGETSRKLYPMKLENDYSPLFALSWTIRHFIDETSPLYGLDEAKMKELQVAIFASLSGLDETFSQNISARSVYRYDEFVYNKKFKDIIVWKDGKVSIDLQGIHTVID